MYKRQLKAISGYLLAGSVLMFVGCSNPLTATTIANAPLPSAQTKEQTPNSTPDTKTTTGQKTTPTTPSTDKTAEKPTSTNSKTDAVHVVSDPASVMVLVNKQNALPADYSPANLIDDPNVPFIFSGKDEKRLMRKDMAEALEKMIAAAKKDGVGLAGVSAYRSYNTQKSLFNYYVQTQGEKQARRYSAVPGTSEHETGLAIDLSGTTGKCAADDCFGGTPEANWIATHCADYGFIVRYPQGKESITGYAYEPWHVRYVGVDVAKEITSKGLTLEEYLQNATPVSK
ncbi:MAG: M15 family metallopeptidase [Tumebacillaceae bacterium]